MVTFANSQRISHAPLSANPAVVGHVVGAMETGVDVGVGEVEVAGMTGQFCIFV